MAFDPVEEVGVRGRDRLDPPVDPSGDSVLPVLFLGDGYSLLQAGRYDEAEDVLQRALELAPSDYELVQGNLEYLRSVRSEDR